MPTGRESDLDRRLSSDRRLSRRLDAYFADLRSTGLHETLKRRTANWQVYAAVTGSAIAMATGASAAILGNGTRGMLAAEAVAASVLAARPFASSRNNRSPNQRLMGAVNAAVAGQAPSIAAGGIVPLCSTINTIQPGEWATIYGTNLASGVANWNNDFPISLGGTSVTINGRAAYLSYVSPGQINLQAPDDTATGTVAVVVTTGSGNATSYVTLNAFAPSFSLLDSRHVAGIILRSNHSGAYGGGSYDLLGPQGKALGYPTVAARAGDSLELFAVGLGPTTPVVLAGAAFSGAAPVNDSLSLYINNVFVKPTFVGLSSAGLYQINLTLPSGLGEGEVPLQAIIGGMPTQTGVVISLQIPAVIPVGGGTATNGGGTFIPGPVFFSSGGGGTSGGTGGGTGGSGGGGSDRRPRKRPYQPKLAFPPQPGDPAKK